MKRPLISIITICYNEKNIERTCVSIVKQTFQDFEWIVVDGGSTDIVTLSTLKKYSSRINTFISESDKGRFDAMNKGIKKSIGKWIIFMNGGDCFYDLDVLKRVFYHRLYHGIDVLYGIPFCQLNSSFYLVTPPPVLSFDFFKNSCINHQSSFIKRDLFQKYGLYDSNLQIEGDRDKWLSYLRHRCIFYGLNMIIAKYDLSGISSQGCFGRKKQEMNALFDKYMNTKQVNYLENQYFNISAKISFRIRFFNWILNLLKK